MEDEKGKRSRGYLEGGKIETLTGSLLWLMKKGLDSTRNVFFSLRSIWLSSGRTSEKTRWWRK